VGTFGRVAVTGSPWRGCFPPLAVSPAVAVHVLEVLVITLVQVVVHYGVALVTGYVEVQVALM